MLVKNNPGYIFLMLGDLSRGLPPVVVRDASSKGEGSREKVIEPLREMFSTSVLPLVQLYYFKVVHGVDFSFYICRHCKMKLYVFVTEYRLLNNKLLLSLIVVINIL